MKKKIFTLIVSFFVLLTSFQTQSLAAPVTNQSQQNNLKPIAPQEQPLLKKQPLYEDSNENTPVPPPEETPDQDQVDPELNIEAEAYILMDSTTGLILAEKNKDQPRPPASMTKMMTAFIVLDKIKQKEIDWNDEVVVSKRAEMIDESQIFLVENERITIEELFKGLMVQSGNDAAVALAEHIAGSEEEFVALMNQKAKKLGLKNTHFNNVTGLDLKDYPDPPKTEGDHYMSAYDSAILANKLIKTHPKIFDFTTITHYTFHRGTDREQKVINWNRMLKGLDHEYEGVDGVKTGSTQAAGYCFTGTVKQNHIRYISVVMGTLSRDKRFTETAKLYDYGYKILKPFTFFKKGQAIPEAQTIQVADAKEKNIPVVSKDDIRLPIKPEEEKEYTYQIHWKKNLKAPLKKGTVVGTIEILKNGKKIEGLQPFELITNKKVEKANLFERFMDQIAS